MRIAVQIPIKGRASTRVPNKNFRELAGKPLAFWLLDELSSNCPRHWDLFVDSESESVMEAIRDRYGDRFQFHQRNPWFASDDANGNHLLSQFCIHHSQYDIYCQAFITAVTLNVNTIVAAVNELTSKYPNHDSVFLVTEECGWVWYNGLPVNYDVSRPGGLPRSQDALFYKETTGMYAIYREALLKTNCRIGEKPLMFPVANKFAVDIDTMEDFRQAESILQSRVHEV